MGGLEALAVGTAIAEAGQQVDEEDLAGLGVGEGNLHIDEVQQEDDAVQHQRPYIGQRHWIVRAGCRCVFNGPKGINLERAGSRRVERRMQQFETPTVQPMIPKQPWRGEENAGGKKRAFSASV